MYSMRRISLAIISLFIVFPAGSILAMSSSNFAIPSDSMNGGGGDTSSSANYNIHDSIGQNTTGPNNSSSFSQQAGYRVSQNSGELSTHFVDINGNIISSPTLNLSSSVGNNTATGQLATTSSKIRVGNTRTIPTWSLTIAATNGPTAKWIDAAKNFPFNQPTANSALSINPSAATITPSGSLCTTNGITTGTNTTFNQGIVDSITLISANGSAATGCIWDISNIDLLQTIPGGQSAGDYTISMTITVA